MPGSRATPIHLRPATDLAERVLLPGDPHRALAVAQSVLEKPVMFNHHRGLWGYTGSAPDGHTLTVQSTGMGGPSAAIVVEELAALGARAFIRIGTCGALGDGLELGSLLAATKVISADGTSSALGAGAALRPDARLTEGLLGAGERGGEAKVQSATVVSTDLYYDPRSGVAREWAEHGAVAVEMEAATVLRVAERRGLAAACLLAVSDQLRTGARRRISPEALESAGLQLGETALAAFGSRTA